MTFDELLSQSRKGRVRKRPSEVEHRIQQACVRWFNLQYPHLRGRLFAVPNGGRRDVVTGAKLKAEGVVAGVADLILLVTNKAFGALLIEMKKPGGIQSAAQRKWQETVTRDGEYKYVICRSIYDFMREIREYLNDK